MAIVIETIIVCDGCGATYGSDSRHIPGSEHRKQYKDYGWHYAGNSRDLCPDCVTKQKQFPNPSRRRRRKSTLS